MIAREIQEILLQSKRHFLIPASQVASLQMDNNLTHALLVLTKIKYSRIPVLDNDSKFMGELTMPMVTEQMLGLDNLDLTKLDKMKVKDVMATDIKTVEDPYDLEEIMHLLVDAAFIPVVSSQNDFVGIITRREMMKSLNYLAHNFDKVEGQKDSKIYVAEKTLRN